MGLSLFVHGLCQASGAEHPQYNVPVVARVGERVVVGGKTPNGAPGLGPCLCCQLPKWPVNIHGGNISLGRRETGSSGVQLI